MEVRMYPVIGDFGVIDWNVELKAPKAMITFAAEDEANAKMLVDELKKQVCVEVQIFPSTPKELNQRLSKIS